MLTGKFWITPNAVVDVSASEHAIYAKNAMLGLLGSPHAYKLDKHMLSPLPPPEVRRHAARGVPPDALDHLARGADPRLYAIEKWNWVRVRGPAFYLWRLDKKTLKLIRGAKDYWKTQSKLEPADTLDIISLSDSKTQVMRVRELLRIARGR